MIQLVPGAALLILFIFLFVREVKIDHKRYAEQDRLGDEHIMREIEKFLKEKKHVTIDPREYFISGSTLVKSNCTALATGIKLNTGINSNKNPSKQLKQ